jgi:hypothetical protein
METQTLNLELNQPLQSQNTASRMGNDRVDFTESSDTLCGQEPIKPQVQENKPSSYDGSATNLSLTKTAKFGDRQSNV